MKSTELVTVEFTHSGKTYQASVFKYAVTAVVLPDHTVLKTSCVLHTTSNRRSKDTPIRQRCIFDGLGKPLPLELLRRSGNSYQPLYIKFPLTFAIELTS
ncbi:MAG: hypothetical protein WA052_00060 [Microgenomates group bacterium]